MNNTIEGLQEKLKQYEQNGAAKLYFSLNRKMNEMADIMNKHNLATMSIDDAKDKTWERLKGIWESASEVAAAVEKLGESAGITGNEEKDVERKPFVDTIAETRK